MLRTALRASRPVLQQSSPGYPALQPHAHSLPVNGFIGAIGNTPLVSHRCCPARRQSVLTLVCCQIRINSLSEETGCEILGKAEFMNPGGSVKDRAAWGLVKWAEENGES